MPLVPPTTATILDPVWSILNAAKARLNGEIPAIAAITGRLLDNTNPFSQQITNNSWRKMLEYCANLGFTALKQDSILFNIPRVATSDPAIPCWVDWFNFNDGSNLYASPVLPPDLIIPLKAWERPSGQNASFGQPMELFVDGLPGFPKGLRNATWEWRANRMYIPGAQQSMDLRILYMRYLGDFLDVGTTQWFQQSVPLPRCQDPFSLYICAEIAETREELDQAYWIEKAEASARLLCNRDVSMKQRANVRRQSRSGRLECGSGSWW